MSNVTSAISKLSAISNLCEWLVCRTAQCNLQSAFQPVHLMVTAISKILHDVMLADDPVHGSITA